MDRAEDVDGVHPVAEAAVALLASAALFLLTAVFPARDHVAGIVALAAACVAAVVLAATRRGPALAVPLAIAAGLGFDSFVVPPIRDFGSEDWQNWLVIGIYLSLGVLTGMLGERAQRRAERSSAAHDRLAREQSALRRVATLVARGPAHGDVFAAIAEELVRLMRVDHVGIWRFDDDTAIAVASSGMFGGAMPVGARERLSGDSLPGIVSRTGHGARIDDYGADSGPSAERARTLRIGCAVAIPVVVHGRPWGATVVTSRRPGALAPDTEARLGQFTELMATAIGNVQARAELDASRARIVEATDQERRRVVRDLHDGAQQRLVHTVVTLKLALDAFRSGKGDAEPLVSEALGHARNANAELRELAHGILPAALTRGGLRAGVDALVSRLDLPADVDVSADRYPSPIEASAYFVVAEALTNVIKHAHANRVEVTASATDGMLRLRVRDDGIGGASAEGNGLLGIEDRLAALGGSFRIDSPPGRGTLVEATVPLP